MIDRYGEAIEADLHRHYHLDLLDFFRGRHSWRKLRVLLDRLPSSSAYVEAQMDDPEAAESIAAQPEQSRPPRLSDWTPTVARLTDIYDRVNELIAVMVASGGGKPAKAHPAPRPETAVDRHRAAMVRSKHREIVAEVKAAQERWKGSRG